MKKAQVTILFLPLIFSSCLNSNHAGRPFENFTSHLFGGIRGRVLNQRTRQPVKGARVSARGGNSALGSYNETFTDGNGLFTLGGLCSGDFRVLVFAKGYLTYSYPEKVHVVPDQWTSPPKQAIWAGCGNDSALQLERYVLEAD